MDRVVDYGVLLFRNAIMGCKWSNGNCMTLCLECPRYRGLAWASSKAHGTSPHNGQPAGICLVFERNPTPSTHWHLKIERVSQNILGLRHINFLLSHISDELNMIVQDNALPPLLYGWFRIGFIGKLTVGDPIKGKPTTGDPMGWLPSMPVSVWVFLIWSWIQGYYNQTRQN